jgi:asparagine synthase (glutamine-hydrolysing)
VAQTFGTDHHELVIDHNLWETLDGLTRILDEPFADSSVIPTYHVSRMTRRHVTVALSGDGGDEIFAGYNWYVSHYRRRYLDLIPGWAGSIYRKVVYPLLPRSIRGRKLAYNIVLNARDRFVDSVSMFPNRELGLLSGDFLNSVSQPPERVLQHYFDEAPAMDLVSRMQYADVKTYMTADVLTKVDRMSMAASLEVRSPLLDHVWVELVTALPLKMKFRNGSGKYLLRRLAERLGVPRDVLNRPKQGFSLPLVHWMRSEMKKDVTSLLLEQRTLQRGYFRRSAVERLLREHAGGHRDYSAIIWQLLVFELWHRNYLEYFAHNAGSALPHTAIR